MIWLYWMIRREIAHKRRIASAMREMRRYGYKAEWHGLLENKRRNWNKYAT
jgi:hypothetical protein